MVPLPNREPFFRNCTVPVAVFGVSVAVKVVTFMIVDGFGLDVRVTIDGGKTTTVTGNPGEKLPPKLASPT